MPGEGKICAEESAVARILAWVIGLAVLFHWVLGWGWADLGELALVALGAIGLLCVISFGVQFHKRPRGGLWGVLIVGFVLLLVPTVFYYN